MLRKILIIILVIVTLYYIFILNYRLAMLKIQIQKIGILCYNLGRKMDSLKNSFFENRNKPQYINLILEITAYNSKPKQTDNSPFIGAWNNRVGKGTVAVSRDLEKIGLTNGVPIIINGEEMIIKDKMGAYKTVRGKKIKIEKSLDIWMETEEEAFEWGVKHLIVKVEAKYINVEKLIALI